MKNWFKIFIGIVVIMFMAIMVRTCNSLHNYKLKALKEQTGETSSKIITKCDNLSTGTPQDSITTICDVPPIVSIKNYKFEHTITIDYYTANKNISPNLDITVDAKCNRYIDDWGNIKFFGDTVYIMNLGSCFYFTDCGIFFKLGSRIGDDSYSNIKIKSHNEILSLSLEKINYKMSQSTSDWYDIGWRITNGEELMSFLKKYNNIQIKYDLYNITRFDTINAQGFTEKYNIYCK